MDRMSPRRQGDLGELSAMEWLGSQGWFIPAEAVAAGTGVLLGGPKYAGFEVEAGCPLFSVQT
jgi:hypothetical protein